MGNQTIICRCKEKHRDKNGVIRGYTLVDNHGVGKLVSAELLKMCIKQGQIKVTNLKMTSDGRLIDDNIKESMESLGNRINNNAQKIQQSQEKQQPIVDVEELKRYSRKTKRSAKVNNFLSVFAKIHYFFEDMWDTDGDFTIND